MAAKGSEAIVIHSTPTNSKGMTWKRLLQSEIMASLNIWMGRVCNTLFIWGEYPIGRTVAFCETLDIARVLAHALSQTVIIDQS